MATQDCTRFPADGSGTITTGGTAQNLFSGNVPPNGYSVYNPDTADLWIREGGTAAAAGAGSVLVGANGGSYECPRDKKLGPLGPITIVGAGTGQKFTARGW